MLRVFNSIQIVGVFVAWPFLVEWLSKAAFTGATLAFWSAIVLYAVGFLAITTCVYDAIGKEW
jgi:hypothetical protein